MSGAPQQLTSAPLNGGGYTVSGGGAPGEFPGGRDVTDETLARLEGVVNELRAGLQTLSKHLTSELASIRATAERNGKMAEKIGKLVSQVPAAAPAGPAVAPDHDLDGAHGDPAVKKDPKQWKGQSFAGCNMSATSPEFLEAVAELCDWKAEQDEEKAALWANSTNEVERDAAPDKKKYARFSRLDAARARGWAKRLRAGWKPPAKQNDDDGWGDT